MSTPAFSTPPLTVDLVGDSFSWLDYFRGNVPSLVIAVLVVYLGHKFTMKQAAKSWADNVKHAEKAWADARSLEERKWQAEQRLKVYSEHLVLLRNRTERVAKVLNSADGYTHGDLQTFLHGLDLEMDMRYRTYLVCSDEYTAALDLLNAAYDHCLNGWIDNPESDVADNFAALMRSHTDILGRIARSEVQSL